MIEILKIIAFFAFFDLRFFFIKAFEKFNEERKRVYGMD